MYLITIHNLAKSDKSEGGDFSWSWPRFMARRLGWDSAIRWLGVARGVACHARVAGHGAGTDFLLDLFSDVRGAGGAVHDAAAGRRTRRPTAP